ncbi:HXXXD-type acyl-transferase family protein [Rhynchospora pubera]|uniref:HXXXD-type acyl-transferase family protein n=1 Tax=Rhynchospora pubera TaxID=906938 RepID=A0AAV8HTY7_9POAL|nr:HXXXD-type acyl-transferase family protein [Rhynchospora pubera]
MKSHKITKSAAVRVLPSSNTPSGILPFSSIDRCAGGTVLIDTIHVFTYGSVEVAPRIRDAFAKALVYYYPIAGKIIEKNPGEPEIDCTGEGIWFVEAKANCSLEEVNFLEMPLTIPKEQLLPQPPPQTKFQYEILLVQVTEYTCGGFTVGISSSHLVYDGVGHAQFMNAVAEMARGLPKLTVEPVWCRENIPVPAKAPAHGGPPPSFTPFNFTTSIVDISGGSINRIKDLYMAETGQRSSTFEVVTAILLKCRVRAIDLAPEAEIRLGFLANTRHLLHGVLPSVEGYYGNCAYPIGITKSSEEINDASLVEVISFIQGAKKTLSSKFEDWINGGTEANQYMSSDYGTLVVSDWSKMGLNEVDFGWGPPRSVMPLNDNVDFIASAIYLKPPLPKIGIRLVLRCVKEERSAVFCAELSKFA